MTNVELSPLVSKSTVVAPLDGSQEIGVLLSLPSSDPAGLAAFVEHVSNPSDALFHQYLTPTQFAERFGGNEADFAALKNWAFSNGLMVSQESVGRLSLTVRGSVSQFERIFKTQLSTYRSSKGDTFYSASIKPSVPAEIASKISGVVGLTSSKTLAPLAKVANVLGEEPKGRSDKMRADTAGGTGPGGTYSCLDLQKAYSVPAWGRLIKSQTVALFEQGYYNPKDVEKYFKTFKVGKKTKQTAVAVDGSPITFEGAIELEACLDVDMVVGLNPSITEVQVYIDDYNYDPFDVAMVDAFEAVAAASTIPQIMSVSYGEDEGYFGSSAETAEDTALQMLASLGVTVFASSGDNGCFGDGFYLLNTSDPASDPYITGVGGTTLFTYTGQLWIDEIAWDDLDSGYGATGGGVSTFWSIPSYQANADGGAGYCTANGGSSTFRNVPDVAAIGDPLTGVGVYLSDQGGWVQVGGTSVSSPVWAGYISNLNAAFDYFGLGPLGFFNPILYNVGALENAGGPGASYPAYYLYDIVQGQNGYQGYSFPFSGYFNGFGYSNTTGSGSIWGAGFSSQVLTGLSKAGTVPGSISSFAVTTKGKNAKFTWTASSGAIGYELVVYHHNILGLSQPSAYVTKDLTYTVKNLPPLPTNDAYYAYIWAFNASGGYFDPTPVNFDTK